MARRAASASRCPARSRGRQSCYGVVDVDFDRHSRLYVGHEQLFARPYEVEGDVPLAAADVGGMVVAGIARIGEHVNPFGRTGGERGAEIDEQLASGLYQLGETGEALAVGLGGAVDVEMVGIGSGDYGKYYGRRRWNERSNSSASTTLKGESALRRRFDP